MTPRVIDIDECGAAEKRSHGADSNFVRQAVIVGELVSRGNQSTERATPVCPDIGRTDGMGIDVPCEFATAPVLLVFYERPSLFDDLNLEWFRHNNLLSHQILA